MTTTIMLLVVIILPFIGVMMALTPYLMKKSECFAVTVPTSALQDPYLKGLKRHYSIIMLTLTVLLTAAGFGFSLTENAFGTLLVVVVGSLLICFVGYGLMLHYRKKVRTYKTKQNWKAEQQEAVAMVDEPAIPTALSLKWNVLYIPLILLTFAIGYLGYAHMPDVIVMQFGLDGEPSRVASKTPLIILLPVLIQVFLGGVFTFSHWMITRSKRGASATAPATSALAYGMFARAQSIFLLTSGLIVSALMIMMPLSFMGLVGLMQAAVAIMVGALVIVIGAIAIAIVYGQGGSRLFARMQESDEMLADNDQYWKLGIFYFNPEDSSLFLLERFGIGWTINWARPAAWAIIVGGLVVTIGFIVIVMAIA